MGQDRVRTVVGSSGVRPCSLWAGESVPSEDTSVHHEDQLRPRRTLSHPGEGLPLGCPQQLPDISALGFCSAVVPGLLPGGRAAGLVLNPSLLEILSPFSSGFPHREQVAEPTLAPGEERMLPAETGRPSSR